MSNYNLTTKLVERKDQDGKIYYLAKLKFPGNIDFTDGVTFFAFISDKGEEQLQITEMNEKTKEKYDKNAF